MANPPISKEAVDACISRLEVEATAGRLTPWKMQGLKFDQGFSIEADIESHSSGMQLDLYTLVSHPTKLFVCAVSVKNRVTTTQLEGFLSKADARKLYYELLAVGAEPFRVDRTPPWK